MIIFATFLVAAPPCVLQLVPDPPPPAHANNDSALQQLRTDNFLFRALYL